MSPEGRASAQPPLLERAPTLNLSGPGKTAQAAIWHSDPVYGDCRYVWLCADPETPWASQQRFLAEQVKTWLERNAAAQPAWVFQCWAVPYLETPLLDQHEPALVGPLAHPEAPGWDVYHSCAYFKLDRPKIVPVESLAYVQALADEYGIRLGGRYRANGQPAKLLTRLRQPGSADPDHNEGA